MADKKVEGRLTIRDAEILPGNFRNFGGEPRKFKPAGTRFFTILLEPELAEMLAADGWKVKYLKPREEDEEPEVRPILDVKLNYNGSPPHVVLITSKNRTPLGESMVGMLDSIQIAKADVVINPYNWSNDELGSGVKAYLKTLFVTMDEDELEAEYGVGMPSSDVPEDESFGE